MAKIYGLFGSMTGKVADVVMSVRNGEQIVRKYQPSVANPSTPAQVETRAKFKLLSQLAEVMADAIAFRRKGSVSARNMFVKQNYSKATYASNQANLPMSEVDLTGGILYLPNPAITRTSDQLSLSMPGGLALDVDRVVYAVYEYGVNGKIMPRGVKVATTPGEGNTFTATAQMTGSSSTGFVVAYGVRDNTAAARTYFGNINFDDATSVAKLLTSSALLESDITITRTAYSAITVG